MLVNNQSRLNGEVCGYHLQYPVDGMVSCIIVYSYPHVRYVKKKLQICRRRCPHAWPSRYNGFTTSIVGPREMAVRCLLQSERGKVLCWKSCVLNILIMLNSKRFCDSLISCIPTYFSCKGIRICILTANEDS